MSWKASELINEAKMEERRARNRATEAVETAARAARVAHEVA